MKKYTWLLIALCFVLGSCHEFGKRVKGNGHVIAREHTVSAFKNLQVSSFMNVYLAQGDLKPIKIEGDENLLEYIEIEQDGDQVIIKNRPGFNLESHGELRIYVTNPVYKRVTLSGAGNIIAENKISSSEPMELNLSGAGDIKMEALDAPKISADISGVGSIYLKGQTKDADVDVSGAGSAHCYDLLAENTKAGISGLGSAEVYASVNLDAEVSGAGSVTYKGNATNVTQHVSGLGSIKKE
jgi:hypothetical protein